MTPAKSVLVRDRGLAGDKAKEVGRPVDGVVSSATKSAASRLTQAKKVSASALHHSLGPEATRLKQATTPIRLAAVKKAAASKSVLAKSVLAKSVLAKSVLVSGVMVSGKRLVGRHDQGAVKLLEGAKALGPDAIGTAATEAKKAVHTWGHPGATELKGLKEVVAAKRQATLKRLAPAKSVLVRQMRRAETKIGAGKPALERNVGRLKPKTRADLGKAANSLVKAGGVAKKVLSGVERAMPVRALK